MAVSSAKRRGRLVYFRLSDDEFEALGQICEVAGARSKSDLIRSALRQLSLEKMRPEASIVGKLHAVEMVTRSIERNLARLMVSLNIESEDMGRRARKAARGTDSGLSRDVLPGSSE